MEKIRNTFANLLFKLGKKDKKIIVIVGDISHGIFKNFRESFKDRYFNIGICEPSMVNISAGLSKLKLIPVVHTIAPFLIERSYEQIKLDFGYQKLGINLVSVGGSFDYSKLGCSHHSYSDVSLISHIKNSNIVIPASPLEFQILFKKIYKKNMINYFRLPDNNHGIKIEKRKIIFGKSVKIRSGNKLTICVTGPYLKNVLEAEEKLNLKGKIDILYFHTIKPFDSKSVLKSVKKTKKLITIEDLSAQGGIYNLCVNSCHEVNNIITKQIAIKDFIHSYGSFDDLKKKAGLDTQSIMNVINNL